MTESLISKQIQAAASKHNARLFRNNVGLFTTNTGQRIRTGLCVGSSDLIGFRSITITPDMVGQTIAQFVACEVKAPAGRITIQQQDFITQVNLMGGCAFIARSLDEAELKISSK